MRMNYVMESEEITYQYVLFQKFYGFEAARMPPSLAEVKEVDLKIQNELKRLKLKPELVKEIK